MKCTKPRKLLRVVGSYLICCWKADATTDAAFGVSDKYDHMTMNFNIFKRNL